jgi:undecaprenyl pyrophosphate phosphatase UppP
LELVLHKLPIGDPMVVDVMPLLDNAATMWPEVFNHFLHGPTALILAIFFFKRWFFLVRAVCINTFLLICYHTSYHMRRVRTLWMITGKIIFLTAIADITTSFFYLLFRFVVNTDLFPLGLGFAITSILLFSLYFCHPVHSARWRWQTAIALGMVQGLALLPGISRFAITFVGARWLNFSNKKAGEISFLIQWPLITAGFMHGAYHIRMLSIFDATMLWIMIGSGIAAFISFCWVYYMLMTNKLWYFAWYLPLPTVVWLYYVLKP